MVGPIVLALIKEYHNAGESIFLREEIRRGFLLLPGKQGAEFWGGGLRQIGAPMELPVGATPHGGVPPRRLPFLILWRVNPLVRGNKKLFMHLLFTPVLANFIWVGGGSVGLLLVIVVVVLLLRG